MRTSTLKRQPGPLWHAWKHVKVHLLEGDFPNLEFLETQAEWLVDLTVTAFVDDLSAISSLDRLRRLSLWPISTEHGHTWSVDLSRLQALEDLSLGSGVIAQLTDSRQSNIRQLHVDKVSKGLCSVIQTLPRLEDLRLDSPRQVPSSIPGSVHKLSLARIKQWSGVRLDGLEGLEYLQLEDIGGIEDFRAFASAPALRRLYVENCPDLSSINGISLREDAEYLFVGRTPLRRTMNSRWKEP